MNTKEQMKDKIVDKILTDMGLVMDDDTEIAEAIWLAVSLSKGSKQYYDNQLELTKRKLALRFN